MAKLPVRLVAGLAAVLLLVDVAGAQEPFPDGPPDDPMYPPFECPDPRSEGASGQWNLFSFTPGCVPPPTHPSGISADEAWRVTTGRPDVVIAVLDTGVDYDHEDLRTKIWLNRGELPVPEGACSPPPDDPHDCNNDGVFNVVDYVGDSRLSDLNGSGVVDRGDLWVFADDVDKDGNGYVDDLSGWDTDDDDADEFDHRYFGHGTGRAGIAAPATNNGVGVAGVCPDCPLMNVRVDDTFVVASDGVAKGALYAIDNGASVLNMALGATTASRLSRGAFDYATVKNVLAVNASANEFSYHHNFQTVFDDVMAIGGVTPDNRQDVTTYLQKANFANYGSHLDVVAPTVVPGASQGRDGEEPDHSSYTESASGTSSSVPHAAGVAALVFSRARDLIENGGLDASGLGLRDISTQEVRQIINASADDVTAGDLTAYPVSEGWDRWTGYGRIDAKAAVDMVGPGTIPPEADINAPDWYRLIDGAVTVRFYANARWASSFSYEVEWGAGVEPSEWATLASGTGEASEPSLSSANRVSNFSAGWDAGGLPEGLYTLRLRVTDDLGNVGRDRMAVWVRHEDPDDVPGFPRRYSGSVESLSVSLVDLNGDNRLEIVFADGNGMLHAVQSNGRELQGFPVHTRRVRRLPLATSDAFDGDQANGEVPVSFAPVLGGTTVGDIDRDGVQEIVVAATDGRVYCWNADGSRCPGFPVATDPGSTREPYGDHRLIRNNHPEAIIGTPAFGNLRGDRRLEIVVGSLDQKLYAWRADGTRLQPFPIRLVDRSAPADERRRDRRIAPRAIASSAAIANVDASGPKEIVIGTNETYSTPSPPGAGGSGRAYVVTSDGRVAPGWPVKPTSIAPDPVPLVAEGVGTSPILGNVDGDPQKEIALGVFFGDATIYNHDGTVFRTLPGSFGGTGPGSDQDEATVEGGLPRAADAPSHYYVAQQAFARFDGDGGLDYLTGTVGDGIALFATGAGTRAFFDHLLSVWDAASGTPKPMFPRVMEDWMFLTGPAVADVGGDTQAPEVIASSGGFFVHAFDATGTEPEGWPKLTGHWQTSTPSVGDLDGDGDVDVVQTTRMGYVFAWSTGGGVCQPDEWRKFRHDEWNTGTYGTDTRRPARIDDLRVARLGDRVTLRWTAPGDDGDCGRAAAYQVRVSSGPIDASGFGLSLKIAGGEPGAAGSEEALTFTLPEWARFVAIRAVDDVRNVGHLTIVGPLPR
jgi:subtilisin family serine protease